MESIDVLYLPQRKLTSQKKMYTDIFKNAGHFVFGFNSGF